MTSHVWRVELIRTPPEGPCITDLLSLCYTRAEAAIQIMRIQAAMHELYPRAPVHHLAWRSHTEQGSDPARPIVFVAQMGDHGWTLLARLMHVLDACSVIAA